VEGEDWKAVYERAGEAGVASLEALRVGK